MWRDRHNVILYERETARKLSGAYIGEGCGSAKHPFREKLDKDNICAVYAYLYI